MKVKVCLDCAGKYLTGQYDPIDEQVKRRESNTFFDNGTCDFCGEVPPTNLLVQRASGGALIDLKTGHFIRKWCNCG